MAQEEKKRGRTRRRVTTAAAAAALLLLAGNGVRNGGWGLLPGDGSSVTCWLIRPCRTRRCSTT